MSRVVPSQIQIVRGSEYNVDPDLEDGVDSFLLQRLQNGEQLTETEFIPTPIVQIPLGVMEDSLVGAIDLENSLETGTPIFSPSNVSSLPIESKVTSEIKLRSKVWVLLYKTGNDFVFHTLFIDCIHFVMLLIMLLFRITIKGTHPEESPP